MRSNRGRDTGPERLLRSSLHAAGLRFRKHLRPLPGVRCEADIVFPRWRVAVFVDGCFWHGCPVHATWPATNAEFWEPKLLRNRVRDDEHNRALAEAGWLVVRLWEHQPLDEMRELVTAALGSRGLRASQGTTSGTGSGQAAPRAAATPVGRDGGLSCQARPQGEVTRPPPDSGKGSAPLRGRRHRR